MKQPIDFNLFFYVLGFFILLVSVWQVIRFSKCRSGRQYICVVPALFLLMGMDMPQDRLQRILNLINPNSFGIILIIVSAIFLIRYILRQRKKNSRHQVTEEQSRANLMKESFAVQDQKVA